MKKFLICCLFIILPLSACVKTPMKTDVLLIEDAELSNLSEENQQVGAQIVENTLLTKKWTEEFTRSSSSFYIDSEIEIPILSNQNLVMVAPDLLTISEISNLLNELFSNVYLCEQIDFDGNIIAKGDIENRILELKQAIMDINNDKDTSDGSKAEHITVLEEMINYLEKQYASAPEVIEYPPIMLDDKYLEDGLIAQIREYNSDKIIGRLFLSSATSEDGKDFNILFLYENDSLFPEENHMEKSINFSENESLDVALEAIKILGLQDDVTLDYIDSVYEDVESMNLDYEFYFVKDYYGLKESINWQSISHDIFQDDIFEYVWTPEYVVISVRNGQIVSIGWDRPSKIVVKSEEQIQLADFNSIKEVFKNQLEVQEIWIPEDSYIESRRIYIDNIQLNVMKVRKLEDVYEMRPVWDFYGYSIDKYREQEPGGWLLDENLEYKNKNLCFMTIDAMTGKIIDRSRGY